jgi:hypothetical protein
MKTKAVNNIIKTLQYSADSVVMLETNNSPLFLNAQEPDYTSDNSLYVLSSWKKYKELTANPDSVSEKMIVCEKRGKKIKLLYITANKTTFK